MMDRFREPTAEDDYSECQQCFRKLHYEKLNDDGICKLCEELNAGTELPARVTTVAHNNQKI